METVVSRDLLLSSASWPEIFAQDKIRAAYAYDNPSSLSWRAHSLSFVVNLTKEDFTSLCLKGFDLSGSLVLSLFFFLLIYFSLIMSYFNVFFSGWSQRHIVISWDPAYVCVCLGLILEKEMATHSSILSWRIPWMEEPGGLQSMGSQRVGHDWVTSLLLFTLVWFKSVTFTTCYS